MSHGHTRLKWKSPTYRSWDSMRRRCDNPKATKYENYGGRGFSYDDRWKSFSCFLEDMGERPDNTSLDRTDTYGDYCKNNCRWATHEEQNRNTRSNKFITYDGCTKTNQEWANELNIPPSTLYNRIFTRGWDVKRSFETPIRNKRK